MKLPSIIYLEFKLSNLMHSALVSISGSTDEMVVHVQLINSFFKKIFGVEHIRFVTHDEEIILKDAKHRFIDDVASMVMGLVKIRISKDWFNKLKVLR